MIVRRMQLSLLITLLAVVAARASMAQGVATVAVLDANVEIGRAGTWTPAAIGTEVQAGDQVRTDSSGRARLVFQDGSVLNLGGATQIVVEQQSVDAGTGIWHSVIKLVRGKIRPLVSEYYQRPGSVYEIETATAVAGVHGTEFVMTYDPVGDVSQVVGVTGSVAVHSVMDRVRRGVVVTPEQMTVVARGKFPTPPERVPPTLFREYIEDLQFIGLGRSESLTARHPVLAGTKVPPPDRPGPALLRRRRERDRQDPSAGGILEQPGPSVQKAGNLGIGF